MLNSFYLFVSTNDSNISERCIILKNYVLIENFSDTNNNIYFYSNNENDDPYYFSVINDQKDYSIQEEIKNQIEKEAIGKEHDSLISYAHISGRHFIAKTDFWGIQHHYYFISKETFVCSNNAFIIAKLIDAKLSKESFFEYLFFLSPLNKNTWFEDIKLLEPNHTAIYNLDTKEFKLIKNVDPFTRLVNGKDEGDIVDKVEEFYKNSANVLAHAKALIGLSSGSDSRTVLSGLLKFDMLDKAVSFGRSDFIETQDIKELAKKIDIEVDIHDFSSLLTDWESNFINYSILTNGLLNPFRVHYVKFYNLIGNNALYEGILGSEFVKGEIAIDAMTSQYHKEVITGNMDVKEVINHYFGLFSEKFRLEMEEYIIDSYGSMLKAINTFEGQKEYSKFALNFIPSRIFSAVITLAMRKRKVYFPFLSPGILSSVFRSYGIIKYNTIRNDFPGPIKCLIPEAKIVKQFDRRLYNHPLDRLFSLKEALEYPGYIVRIISKYRKIKKNYKYPKHIRGQVDHSQLRSPVEGFIRKHSDTAEKNIFESGIGNSNFIKEKSNQICIGKILKMDFSTLIEASLSQKDD